VEGLPFSIDWLPDGRLVARWADLGPGSAPDGICADAEGAIWYASVPGQRCSRVAVGGDVLDTVDADRGCFACMLGGDDGRTLYIVANRYTDGSVSRCDGAPRRRLRPARSGRLDHLPEHAASSSSV
jgi:sugar lactone lactonase YvrE